MPPAAMMASLPAIGTGGTAPQAFTPQAPPTLAPLLESGLAALSMAGMLGGVTLTNVLPWALPPSHHGDPSLVYVAEGLSPIPRQLVNNVLQWKFIDMAELLPEYWPLAKGEDDPKRATYKRPKQVTEFHTWLQCFGTYCAVLGKQYPAAVPELMSYLLTISHQDLQC